MEKVNGGKNLYYDVLKILKFSKMIKPNKTNLTARVKENYALCNPWRGCIEQSRKAHDGKARPLGAPSDTTK
ncbi:hypothetical protein NMYAN_110116 [Nitrosomonas nitrosa]|uniref:Uncharacterized protein n=1 Tax=Nitrosomonas nitrosa TaxID=52442 RepID=A0A8H8YX55_9PROT|nr:hypothetical protein NMYAN_110116 [Nitrosomonas nitrosa]